MGIVLAQVGGTSEVAPEHIELFLPQWLYAALAIAALVSLLLFTFAFRNIANRQQRR